MRRGLLLCSWFLGLAGCAAPGIGTKPGSPEPITETYTVTAAQTPFYSFGPAQAMGPDFVLKKGAPVTMLRPERGYSWVRTENGREGYVAADQIAPLPPEPMPRFLSAGKPEKLKVDSLDQMFADPPLPTR